MTEQQADLQERELDYWMARAYEAEGKLWKAEARIKAARDMCDDYSHTAIWGDKERIATSDIRRALDGACPHFRTEPLLTAPGRYRSGAVLTPRKDHQCLRIASLYAST